MTEISLIVTLNNQFTLPYLPFREVLAYLSHMKDFFYVDAQSCVYENMLMLEKNHFKIARLQ